MVDHLTTVKIIWTHYSQFALDSATQQICSEISYIYIYIYNYINRYIVIDIVINELLFFGIEIVNLRNRFIIILHYLFF